MLKALIVLSCAPWAFNQSVAMETAPVTQTPVEILPEHSIRISANHQFENLENYPGTINIIDSLTNTIVGVVDKKATKNERINVNSRYGLSQIHSNGVMLDLRYDEGGAVGQIMPIRFYKGYESMGQETCPIFSQQKKTSSCDKEEWELVPLLAIRLNIMENIVVGGTSPLRASGYYRHSVDALPIDQYFGLTLAQANSFWNDEVLFKHAVSNAPLSVPLQPVPHGIYVNLASSNDFHKGQLYVINEYLKQALVKYKPTVAQLGDLDPLLNFFVTKGVMQTNEKAKYLVEMKTFLANITHAQKGRGCK